MELRLLDNRATKARGRKRSPESQANLLPHGTATHSSLAEDWHNYDSKIMMYTNGLQCTRKAGCIGNFRRGMLTVVVNFACKRCRKLVENMVLETFQVDAFGRVRNR